MKETSYNYLNTNAEFNKNGCTLTVRVCADHYQNRNTDKLVWITTKDVVGWLLGKGHKVKTVEQEGFLRNRYSSKEVTWVFSTKNKADPKKTNTIKELKTQSNDDKVKASNKTKKV